MDYKKVSIIVLALVLVLALALFFLSFQEFRFSREYNGIMFVSNYNDPNQMLKDFSSKKTFFSILTRYPKSNTVQYLDNATVLESLILNGNDKNAVQIIRDLDSKGEEYCNTNYGNHKTSVNLNKEQCDLLIASGKDAVKIYLNFPNTSLQKPRIVFGENEIQIMPQSYKDISTTTFYSLEAMFPNATDLVSKANGILVKVGQ